MPWCIKTLGCHLVVSTSYKLLVASERASDKKLLQCSEKLDLHVGLCKSSNVKCILVGDVFLSYLVYLCVGQLKRCVHKLSKSQKVDLRKSPLKLWT